MRISKRLAAKISIWTVLVLLIASGFGVFPQRLSNNVALADDDDNDPNYQHVLVHYDYMVAPDHTHLPDPAFIQAVVDAYKRHGIMLHIGPDHTAIPETNVTVFGPAYTGTCGLSNTVNFGCVPPNLHGLGL
jgi:hypothetical protein